MKADDNLGQLKDWNSDIMALFNEKNSNEENDDSEESDFELDESDIKTLNDETSNIERNSIKDELRMKIQTRRLSKGQGELKVEFEPPKKYQLTAEERRKMELRKRRNRLSANQSRIKRQQHLDNLLKDEKTLTETHQTLKAEVEALQKFKLKLEFLLTEHSLTCKLENKTVTTQKAPVDCQHEQSVRDNESSGNLEESRKETSCYPDECGSDSCSVNREHLRTLSKDQKIAILKAYLKGNQSKPEIQNLIGKIADMTEGSQCEQT